MAFTALISLWLNGWVTQRAVLAIVFVFGAGGGLAFTPALILARLVSAGRPAETRFAAGFLSFAAVTFLFTALIYAAQSRLSFHEGHAEPFTTQWALELGFGIVGAFFRFALFGAPLYFPLGLLFLFALGLWHARHSR